MHYRLTACGIAVAAAFASGSAFAAPTVSWKQPYNGKTVSGTISGSACEATGSSIRYVRFYVDNKQVSYDPGSPWNCSIDTRQLSNGTHYLRAVAYDSSGASRSHMVSVNVQNGSTSTPSTPTTGTGPSVSWTAPASGGTLTGNIQQSTSQCQVSGTGIARVVFSMDSTQLNTELSAPYLCNVDTTKFSNGTHTLKAVAYNSSGASTTITRPVTVQNGTVSTPTTGPTIAFTAPAEGGTLSGNVQGPPNCVVQGSSIARVMFYLNDAWTNTDGNLDNGLGCWIDTTKYANGTYTVKAVAYDSSGRTATTTRSIKIQNGTSSGGTSGPPAVAIVSPAAGATISGDLKCEANASDSGGSIARVDFLIDNKNVASDSGAPYTCTVNTASLANGSHNLTAIATDNSGLKSSVTRSFNVQNTVSQPDDPAPGAGIIDAADIVTEAQASVPFSQQKGYNTQVINTYLQANQIPESGIHGTTLPNGETLRLGKQTDPRDSTKKALAFQIAPNDPTTSGSRRAELRYGAALSNDKVYWAAYRHYVYDWGTLPTSDVAIIAMQVHGGNVAGLSPAVGIYSRGGRNFWIDARGSTASSPSQSNSVSVKSPERPIQFGRWVDFVIKFKLNTSGKGFVQVWMDGTQIWSHAGTVGYNTGTERPYFKFGYYNWTSFQTPRKVLLKSPVVVADPTGSKYSPEALRQYIQSK
jgi:hypothetical protein